MNYLLDSNALSDILQALRESGRLDMTRPYARVYARLVQSRNLGYDVGLCEPVLYEVRRGLIYAKAHTKLAYLDQIRGLLGFVPLTTPDWEAAAQLWADLQSRGRALSDVDLLIAGVSLRTGATLVSADADFKAVPTLAYADWRAPLPNA